MNSSTLKRLEIIPSKLKYKATHSFAHNFKLQQEVLKFNDIRLS